MSVNKIRLGACAAASIALFAGAAQAGDDVLLLVDLSVPNEITITGTDGLSAATASGGDFTGIYLDNLYGGAGDALGTAPMPGDFTSDQDVTDTSASLFRAGSGADPGLNIFSFVDGGTINFVAGERAFSGSASWSLDANEYDDLVAGNAAGDIFFPADDAGDVAGATVLGTYRVIPTPGALAVFGLAGTAVMRRRR